MHASLSGFGFVISKGRYSDAPPKPVSDDDKTVFIKLQTNSNTDRDPTLALSITLSLTVFLTGTVFQNGGPTIADILGTV